MTVPIAPKKAPVRPLVSMVMPIRNEAAFIERSFAAIREQSYPADRIEIVVVDGGSTDGTIELVRTWMARDPQITLLGGPGVNTPLAMNLGITASSGSLVAKVDGHGWMNAEFIETAVDVLAKDQSVGCVGGRIVPVAETDVERANSYARFSRLGVGAGVYTAPDMLHATDTVQCGVYRRSALADAGGFDPFLAYGEDEELNYRVRLAGWSIVFHPGMQFHYRVRPSVASLFRQYLRYGRARVAVVRKHPRFFRAKHAMPGALVLALVVALLLLVADGTRVIGAVVLATYGLLVAAGATWLAAKYRFPKAHLIAASLLALHLGYGLGALRGLWDIATRPSDVAAEERANDRP